LRGLEEREFGAEFVNSPFLQIRHRFRVTAFYFDAFVIVIVDFYKILTIRFSVKDNET
jgi:hypothetical protein